MTRETKDIRITIPEETYNKLKERYPVALNDSEVIRCAINDGLTDETVDVNLSVTAPDESHLTVDQTTA